MDIISPGHERMGVCTQSFIQSQLRLLTIKVLIGEKLNLIRAGLCVCRGGCSFYLHIYQLRSSQKLGGGGGSLVPASLQLLFTFWNNLPFNLKCLSPEVILCARLANCDT